MLCRDCENFIPNGGTTSFEAVYNLGKGKKLGNCKTTNELKNELNSCKLKLEESVLMTTAINKEEYLERLNAIMEKFDLDGGFLHSTYERGINTENLTPCYVDARVKNSRKLGKELAILLDDYFEEFPEAKRPLYSYK